MKIDGIEFDVVMPARRGGNGSTAKFSEDEIVLSIDKSGAKGVVAYALRLSVHKSLAKKAGLGDGDKVQIGFNQKRGLGFLQLISDGGYKLSSCAKKSGRLYIKPNWRRFEMPSVASPVGCPTEVKVNCIVFVLPDCVSFERNLRAEADAK